MRANEVLSENFLFCSVTEKSIQSNVTIVPFIKLSKTSDNFSEFKNQPKFGNLEIEFGQGMKYDE